MSTSKQRKNCSKCGKKLIVDKMIFDKSWFCLNCKDETLFIIGTNLRECPIGEHFKVKYSSDLYLFIRQTAPSTFEYAMLKRHGVVYVEDIND
jgi:hypothetical protein